MGRITARTPFLKPFSKKMSPRLGALTGARLRVIATVQDPRVVQAILAHLARSGAPAPPGPAAAPLCPVLDRAPAPLPDDSGPAPDHHAHARLRPPRTGPPASGPGFAGGGRTWRDAATPAAPAEVAPIVPMRRRGRWSSGARPTT